MMLKGFYNHFNNIKEMITYFKYKNHKSKERFKNYKTLNTTIEAVASINIIAATSITLSITDTGLNILPLTARIACTLSSGNKVLHILVINKEN